MPDSACLFLDAESAFAATGPATTAALRQLRRPPPVERKHQRDRPVVVLAAHQPAQPLDDGAHLHANNRWTR